MPSPAVELIAELHRRQNEMYSGGSVDQVAELLAEDIVWHVPGTSPIAGDHRGIAEVFAYFERRRQLANSTMQMQPGEVLESGDAVAQFVAGSAVLDGKRVTWQTIGVYRVDVERKVIQEVWLVPLDSDLFDRIWSALAAEPPPQSRRRVKEAWAWLRAKALTRLGAVIGFAASVATLGGVLVALTAGGPPPPGQMSGDLNVAVAAFTTNGGTTEEGVALARDVARVLRSELPRLDPSLQVEVRGPGMVGAVDGGDSGSQAQAAKKLAKAIGADIVVYGDLAADPQETRLRPVFYLNAAKLPSASTLGGGYSYGGPITLPYALAVSPPARAQIRTELIHRTEDYAQVFIGVGYYLLHELTRAEPHLRHALAGAPTPAVAALLHLLLGNIADRQGHTKIAARDYSLATHNAATGRRAQLGLADVRYQLGHKHCRPGEPSLPLLRSARQGFSTVLHALGGIAAARTGSPLAAKAAFGEGQVDLCLSAAGHVQRWPTTRREFTATIAAYRPSLPELRDDAAEAHAGLGLYYLSVERAPAAYEDARREYRAAHLSTLRRRRAYFDGVVGFADVHLHEYSAAVAMYDEGAQLAAGTPLERSLARKAERLSSKERADR